MLLKFCNEDSTSTLGLCPAEIPFSNNLFCLYGSSFYKNCTADVFLREGTDFIWGDDSSIIVNNGSETIKFDSHEYSNQTGMNQIIYVCGQEETITTPFEITLVTLTFVSIAFFLLCIVLNSNKERLRDLPNRTLYSYCISQMIYLITVIDLVYISFTYSCFYMKLLNNASAMCALLWNCVVLFEYSRVIYYLIRNNRRSSDEIQMKRYFLYCLICWILPSILHLLLMFHLSPIDGKSSSCPKIGHYSLIYCEYEVLDDKYWNVLEIVMNKLNIIVSVFVTIGVCAITLAMIYLSRQDYITSHSTSCIIIFLKMMFAISFHFIFHFFSVLLSLNYEFPEVIETMDTLFNAMDYCQGILIFFAFYFKKSMFRRVLMICKLKTTTSSDSVEVETLEQSSNVHQ